ncbi:MAG TPA: phosphatase PAP2 family protein [Anaerolineae bacterium]|nr:phosphatase PAP2 family protein [Anaerolineae bacterium]HQK14098.1 phosphatase PAP2 family protein [Anaerolineae bacterium]
MTIRGQSWLERDRALTAQAATLIRGPLARWLATLLAHSGDTPVWLLLGAALWRFGAEGWARAGERIVLVTSLAWMVSTVLKPFFRRPRPEGERGHFYLKIDRHSFPSGHAVRVGGLLAVLSGLLPLWSAAGFIAWGLLVCLSRVALGLHYAGDVTIGLLIGIGVGLALLAVL